MVKESGDRKESVKKGRGVEVWRDEEEGERGHQEEVREKERGKSSEAGTE